MLVVLSGMLHAELNSQSRQEGCNRHKKNSSKFLRMCLVQDSFLAQFGGSGKETQSAKATLARYPLRTPALEPWYRAVCYVADIGPGQAHAIVHAHPSLGELMCHYADPARCVLAYSWLPSYPADHLRLAGCCLCSTYKFGILCSDGPASSPQAWG